jgi:hypothetical protein
MVDNYTDFTKNTAKLPQEKFSAPTIGVGLALPKFTDTIGLSFSLDTMLVGTSLKQTANLEDGANPSAKGFDLGGVLLYKWKKQMSLQGNYDLYYMSNTFGMPPASSQRGHMGSSTSRTDIFHTLTFGVAYGF